MKKRVLLADDHPIVLEGLRSVLEPEYTVVEAVRDGRALVEAAERLRPDVIVCDIAMPELSGLEALRRLGEAGRRAKVVLMTMHSSVEFAAEAVRLGASGYVLKHDAAEELPRALRTVLDGGLYLTPAIADDVQDVLARHDPRTGPAPAGPGLTPREREVLQLVAEGRTAKEIAGILGISARTAEHHKYSLMDKLKLRSTAALTLYAVQQGVVQPPEKPGGGSAR